MSANNTQYRLFLQDDTEVYMESKNKAAVIKAANQKIAEKIDGIYKARVETSAGKVVHQVARRKITKVTKPGTLQIKVPKAVQAVVGKGFVAAYERPENETVVFRNENKTTVTRETRYAVVHTGSLVLAGWAPTTRAAGQIQNGFAKKALVAQDA